MGRRASAVPSAWGPNPDPPCQHVFLAWVVHTMSQPLKLGIFHVKVQIPSIL